MWDMWGKFLDFWNTEVELPSPFKTRDGSPIRMKRWDVLCVFCIGLLVAGLCVSIVFYTPMAKALASEGLWQHSPFHI